MDVEKILWDIPLSIAHQFISVGLWKNGARLRRPLYAGSPKEIDKIEKLLGI